MHGDPQRATTVDGEHSTGDVVGAITHEVADRFSDVLWTTEAPQWDQREYEPGLCSVAVSVDLPLPKPIALNVSCPLSRWSLERVHNQLLPSLQRAANAIANGHRMRPATDL